MIEVGSRVRLNVFWSGHNGKIGEVVCIDHDHPVIPIVVRLDDGFEGNYNENELEEL